MAFGLRWGTKGRGEEEGKEWTERSRGKGSGQALILSPTGEAAVEEWPEEEAPSTACSTAHGSRWKKRWEQVSWAWLGLAQATGKQFLPLCFLLSRFQRGKEKD
jgi:hypothetical protein